MAGSAMRASAKRWKLRCSSAEAGAPQRLVFVVADRVAVGEPGRGEDEGFVQVGAEASRAASSLIWREVSHQARMRASFPACLLMATASAVSSESLLSTEMISSRPRFSQLAGPRRAGGGGGRGRWGHSRLYRTSVHGEVGPGRQPQGVELGDAAFFNQGVAIGGRGRIEPQPGKPDE